jgi:hypothetical protein
VVAGVVTTVAVCAWRWLMTPTVGEGTSLPWTVLGILLAAATVLTDRATRPFTGVATTAAGAGAALLLTDARAGLDPDTPVDVLYVALAAGALAAAGSGTALLVAHVPPTRRRWAGVVVALGAAAWVAWMGWWPVDGSGPEHPTALSVAALGTLVAAAALGEVLLGPWRGAGVALAPAALLAVLPSAASDALGMVAWYVLTLLAAAVCLAVVGVVAAVRAAQRRASSTC